MVPGRPRRFAMTSPSIQDRLESEKLTPMMRQYLSVKADHPRAVVLFRMGDFYEAFYEDAEACARLLDITLTARSKERDIPMAGVPHHAIDGYLSRLVDQGQTVVIVDQVEDPKQAKGLVRREVTRVLSPGTFVDPNAPARVATYLTAVASSRRRKNGSGWGLAALDLSTGEFRATEGDDDDALLDELSRLSTKEVLYREGGLSDPTLAALRQELPNVTCTAVDPHGFAGPDTRRAIEQHVGPDELRGLKTVVGGAALDAAGLALRYAETTQIHQEAPDLKGRASLGHVEPLKPYASGHGLGLDAQAREHLELFVSQGEGGRKGSLLHAIDEATTPMGGRLLARWLAYPLADRARIEARQDAVAALVAAPSRLDEAQGALKGMGDIERLLARVTLGRSHPRDLSALRAALEQAPVVLTAVSRAIPDDADDGGLLASLAAVDSGRSVADLLTAALVDDPSTDVTSPEVFRPGYDPELDRLAELALNGKKLIANLEAKEREETGIANLKVKYNKVFGYYLEVTKTHLKLVPDRYIRKQTTVNSERYFTEELKELETEVLSAEERRVARNTALYADLLAKVVEQVVVLRELAQSVAQIDVLVGFARLAEHRGWVRPHLHETLALEVVDGRHPVVERVADELGERFVPNDLRLDENERLMIITGPNMAGKSTIMRQTALIAILAHMGAYVPAREARIPIIDRIFTRVGASDDLSRGRSTFMVEMNETARILRSATERSLILLDEIGRGTSTFDGLSIAWAVAEYLHDQVGAKTLFATHYHELTEICRDKERAVNRHVAVKEWNDDIVFLRKLLPGPTNRSYGVQVARLAGLPAAVVERAKAVLETLEAQALRAGDGSLVGRKLRGRPLDVSQMHLFEEGPVARMPSPSSPEAEVLDTLERLPLDDLTPRQAMAQLADLQEKLRRLRK